MLSTAHYTVSANAIADLSTIELQIPVLNATNIEVHYLQMSIMSISEKELKRHILWIDQAERFAQESKDRSTKVGCVIVNAANRFVSSGWNGFPEGVDDNKPERHERPAKYDWTVCSERNAINNAARFGNATDGCTLYLNWEPYPCGKCMASLRNAGIIRLVGPDRPFGGVGLGKYYTVSEMTREIIAETGTEVILVPYDPVSKTCF